MGTKTREVMRFMGQNTVNYAEVVEYEVGHKTAFETTAGPISASGYRLVEREGQQARLTYQAQSELSGLYKLLSPLIVLIFRRRVQTDLARLKQKLETKKYNEEWTFLKNTKFYKLTGILLIVTAVGFNLFFTLLATNFEYPDILRFPTGYVLEQYHAGGAGLTLMWYGMVAISILFVPIAVLVHQVMLEENTSYLGVATVCGILSAVMNFLGFIRWVFVVPHLASTYVDPASSEATRDAIVVVFDAFHLYAGFSIGEHLGFIFTGLWVGLIGRSMLKSNLFKPWLGWLGIVSAPLIIFGSFEGAGLEFAADVNVIGFLLWSVWFILTGLFLLRAKGQ